MTQSTTLDAEAPCPEPVEESELPIGRQLIALRRPFDSIAEETWDSLASQTPWATPFSRWCVQRSWWEAYGDTAHDQTIVVVDPAHPDPAAPVAIVPLMHRHEVEPGDFESHVGMRHEVPDQLAPIPPTATAVFFGASYHADYATLLAADPDLPAVAEAVVEHLAGPPSADETHPAPWDVVDLRRIRCGDPAADALEQAFERHADAQAWAVSREREDVCPVLTLPEGADFETYLGTLSKKERHEIRRKIRRAESVGEIRLVRSEDPLADLGAFVDLHQKRWAEKGLFPPTAGGQASRRFVEGLLGRCGGTGGMLQLSFLMVGSQRIAAGLHFEDAENLYFYNAGVDPDARELSPGVVMVAAYVQQAIERGIRRFDFLRGDEPYKYEWGAVDEPIQRLLVRRTDGR